MKIRIFILCIAVIIAINIVAILYFNSNDSENHNQTIINLEKENFRLENENSQLDTLILKRLKITDSLQNEIYQNQHIIQNLNYEIKEKINTINRMSDLELYVYFSNIRTDQKDHRE